MARSIEYILGHRLAHINTHTVYLYSRHKTVVYSQGALTAMKRNPKGRGQSHFALMNKLTLYA